MIFQLLLSHPKPSPDHFLKGDANEIANCIEMKFGFLFRTSFVHTYKKNRVISKNRNTFEI